jgi:hypothetical protein
MFDDTPHERVGWGSRGYNGKNHTGPGYKGHFEFRGLSDPEVAALEGALLGANWVRVKDGRLQFAHAHEKAPPPEPDKDIGPYWTAKYSVRGQKKVRRFRFDDPGFLEAGLHLGHVGAGASGEGAYQANADKLESYGFECLRSRRGNDGRFWEIWYLPSLFFAEGELAEAIAKVKPEGDTWGDASFQRRRMKMAIEFLCRNVNFGTLDAFVQRAALSYD